MSNLIANYWVTQNEIQLRLNEFIHGLVINYFIIYSMYTQRFVLYHENWILEHYKKQCESKMKKYLKLFGLDKKPAIINIGLKKKVYGIEMTYDEYIKFLTVLKLKGEIE